MHLSYSGARLLCFSHPERAWRSLTVGRGYSLIAGILLLPKCCQGSPAHRLWWLQLLVTVTSFGEGNGTPPQYSCMENPTEGGAWKAAVHGVAEGRTRLIDFTFTFHFHALEKEMATHFSVLAWRIPGTGEPGGLPSLGSHRVGHI